MGRSIKQQFMSTLVSTICSIILLSVVTGVLLWTEVRNVELTRQINYLLANVQVLDPTKHNKEDFEGKAALVVGPLQVLEPLSEPDYGIHVLAVKLRKRVQVYQWIEEVSDPNTFTSVDAVIDDSEKTHWYHKDWKDYLVDSSSFYRESGHKNPNSFPFYSETHIADTVKIGWVVLGNDLKQQVSDFYDITSDNRPERSDILLHSGMYYHGESALEHEIGDVRVQFLYAGREDDIYTAVGILKDGVLQPYSEDGDSEASSILRKGSFTSYELSKIVAGERRYAMWKYRIFGIIQVFAAAMTFHPEWLSMVLRSPYATHRMRQNSRLWTNFMLAFSYTFIIISLPWIPHNFKYGITMLGSGIVPLLLCFQLGDGRRVGDAQDERDR